MTENHHDAMRRVGEYFGFDEPEAEVLVRFAVQRNRVARRRPNSRWDAAKFYTANRAILKKPSTAICKYEKSKVP